MVLALAGIQRGNDTRALRVWLVGDGAARLDLPRRSVLRVHRASTTRASASTTNMFGSSFFTLTGFHGAHVTIGVVWLLSLVCASRSAAA